MTNSEKGNEMSCRKKGPGKSESGKGARKGWMVWAVQGHRQLSIALKPNTKVEEDNRKFIEECLSYEEWNRKRKAA